jgi:hypothetical protein
VSPGAYGASPPVYSDIVVRNYVWIRNVQLRMFPVLGFHDGCSQLQTISKSGVSWGVPWEVLGQHHDSSQRPYGRSPVADPRHLPIMHQVRR